MDERRAFLQACRNDFSSFVRKAFQELHGGRALEMNWHIEAISHELDEMRLGPNRRLLNNMPPRTLKSDTISVYWTAFLLGHNPEIKIIVVSYAELLAKEFSNRTRRLMQSAWYQELFPDTQLDRQASEHLSTDRGGMRAATTVGGSLTGLGADWIIVDDPMSATDANSEASRRQVLSFFGGTLSSRLDDPSEGRLVVVMQRLHEDDLSGHLIRRGGWRHLKLEAIATEDREIEIGRGRTHSLKTGDLLLPNRLPAAFLAKQKDEMGSAAYEAQYQQQPVPADGNMIRREWLQYIDNPPPRSSGQLTLSLDTATKTDPANDYSACTAWLQVDQKHHLLDVWRGKVDFPSLLRNVTNLYHQHQPYRMLIEDAGAGTALIQTLQSQGIPVIPRKARDPKEVRLSAVSQYLEAGQVILPREAPWLAEFERELLGFPGARHDDQVDSLSQYLGWVRETTGADCFEYDFFWDQP